MSTKKRGTPARAPAAKKKQRTKPAKKPATKARKKARTKGTAKASSTKRTAHGAAGLKAKRAPAETAEMREQRIQNLSRVFAALGAKNPERWGRDHVERGTDELGRFVLLRALWLRTVEPGRLLGAAREDPHTAEVANRLLGKVSIADLDAIVRFSQRRALEDMCRVLDNPGDDNDGIRWAVFRVDEDGLPLWPLEALGLGLEEAAP